MELDYGLSIDPPDKNGNCIAGCDEYLWSVPFSRLVEFVKQHRKVREFWSPKLPKIYIDDRGTWIPSLSGAQRVWYAGGRVE